MFWAMKGMREKRGCGRKGDGHYNVLEGEQGVLKGDAGEGLEGFEQ